MGFDCTLHVVDPKSLVAFVDRFIGKSKKKHAYDKQFAGGAARFTEIAAKLEHTPVEGARELLQLCLLWCSCDAPHEYSRNFALSYWLPNTDAEAFPAELLSRSLSPHLGAIEAAYPQIAGKLSLGFDGNGSVGFFLEPDRVPLARAFVETQLGEVSAEARRTFQPLLKILRIAEEKQLAYWEATDLPVGMGNPGWLKVKKRATVGLAVQTLLDVEGLYRYARLAAVEGDRLVVTRANPDETHVIDLSASPPAVTHLPDIFFANAVLRDGVLYGRGRLRHKNPYGFYALRIAPTMGEMRLLTPRTDEDLGDLALLDDAFALVPSKVGLTVRILAADGALHDLPLPPSTDYTTKGFMLVSFGDGAHLLCWGKRFYVLEADLVTLRSLEAPPELRDLYIAIDSEHSEQWSDRPGRVLLHAHDGFLRVTRDGKLERFAPEINNIRHVVRGPDRAQIVRQGENEFDDAFKILWPTLEVTSLTAKDFGVAETQGGFYSPTHRSLVARAGSTFLAITWEQIAARPRRTLPEIGAKQAADRQRELARRHKAWKADIDAFIARHAIIRLPIPPEGFEQAGQIRQYISNGAVVEHPLLGLGVVRSRSTNINKEVLVHFEHEDRELRLTDPVPLEGS